jgi:predicted TIM-barrel fold metal-dependent hydrolase
VYDGFWGLAAEAGVVVATHAGLDGYDVLVQMWEPGRAEQSVLRSPLRGVLTKGRAVADFYGAALCHLIFERFPRLRMASVENGAGWIPDLLHRLDDVASRNPGAFKQHPREVFGEHVWVTPFWEDQVDDLLGDVRVDRLLLGSDWPHAEGVVEPVDFVTESLGSLSADDVRKVSHDNALEALALQGA